MNINSIIRTNQILVLALIIVSLIGALFIRFHPYHIVTMIDNFMVDYAYKITFIAIIVAWILILLTFAIHALSCKCVGDGGLRKWYIFLLAILMCATILYPFITTRIFFE